MKTLISILTIAILTVNAQALPSSGDLYTAQIQTILGMQLEDPSGRLGAACACRFRTDSTKEWNHLATIEVDGSSHRIGGHFALDSSHMAEALFDLVLEIEEDSLAGTVITARHDPVYFDLDSQIAAGYMEEFPIINLPCSLLAFLDLASDTAGALSWSLATADDPCPDNNCTETVRPLLEPLIRALRARGLEDEADCLEEALEDGEFYVDENHDILPAGRCRVVRLSGSLFGPPGGIYISPECLTLPHAASIIAQLAVEACLLTENDDLTPEMAKDIFTTLLLLTIKDWTIEEAKDIDEHWRRYFRATYRVLRAIDEDTQIYWKYYLILYLASYYENDDEETDRATIIRIEELRAEYERELKCLKDLTQEERDELLEQVQSRIDRLNDLVEAEDWDTIWEEYRLRKRDLEFWRRSGLRIDLRTELETETENPRSVVVEDFDCDGYRDICVLETENDIISTFRNSGDGQFEGAVTYAVHSDPTSLAAGDLNGDQRTDLVLTHGDNRITVMLNAGDGNYELPDSHAVGTDPRAVKLADLNGDGSLDVVTADAAANAISILLNDGTGNLGVATTQPAGVEPVSLALGDLDRDLDVDIVAANHASNSITVLYNDGFGNIDSAAVFSVGSGPLCVAAGDLNGDEYLDLATANSLSQDVSVLTNDGAGGFPLAKAYAIGAQPQCLALGDMTDDGYLDIVTANPGTGEIAILVYDGDSVFAEPVTLDAAGSPVSMAMADINGDLLEDVTVSSSGIGEVTIFINASSDPFDGDCNGNGFPDGLDIMVGESVDLNGDGIPDECQPTDCEGYVPGSPKPFVVQISKTHNTHQGTVEEVSITVENGPFEMGGFDFLIAYDASALNFISAERGQLLEDCDWEYFTYRHGAAGNCVGGCPSGLLRVTAIADLDNGPTIHPSCFGPPDPDPHEVVRMRFYVTEDLTFEGQYIPVKFYWADCGDNAISSVDGNTTYLDRAIYNFTGLLLWDEEDDDAFPEDARPQGLGAPDVCLEGSGPDKPQPLRFVDYWFGGIDIIPRDSLDAPGDINLNGINNEVADAVLFSNYFIFGDAVWDPPYMEGQIAATDINMDGIVLTVADLVYLIRIITGDETPFPKVAPQESPASVDWRMDDNELVVNWRCQADAGAVLLAFDHRGAEFGEPVLGENASGMKMISHNSGAQLRVLIHGMERGAKIAAGEGTILRVPIVTGDPGLALGEVEAADYWGNMMIVSAARPAYVPSEFALFQNIPNPFNATTRIDFNLPEAGDVNLAVYNVLGQRVTTLVNDCLEPGRHHIEWDARDNSGRELASGVYLYRIVTGSYRAHRKMVLLK